MNDDLISRKSLKEAIEKNGCRHSHYFDIFDVIDNAPPAKSNFRHVILKHPRFGKCDAIYDEARRLFYVKTISRELLDKYGWTFDEVKEGETDEETDK